MFSDCFPCRSICRSYLIRRGTVEIMTRQFEKCRKKEDPEGPSKMHYTDGADEPQMVGRNIDMFWLLIEFHTVHLIQNLIQFQIGCVDVADFRPELKKLVFTMGRCPDRHRRSIIAGRSTCGSIVSGRG